MSYDGVLEPESIAVGAPYDSISATGCVSFSALPVEVDRFTACRPVAMGTILTAAGAEAIAPSASPTRSSTSTPQSPEAEYSS